MSKIAEQNDSFTSRVIRTHRTYERGSGTYWPANGINPSASGWPGKDQ